MSNSQYLKFALELSEKAGKKLYDAWRGDHAVKRGTSKEVHSLYDIVVDDIIKKAIEKKYPTHSYITEETGYVEKDPEYLWVIDPVDGTSNFENHNPFFSISIALWVKGQPAFGVIEAPALRERFYAETGKGAYRIDLLRNKKIRSEVSDIKDIKNSFFVFCEGGNRTKQHLVDIYKKLYPKMKDFRKIGSAALELAWVGSGRAEGYCTTHINFYDIAAGIIYVKEAGGSITDFKGKPYDFSKFKPLGHYNLIATNGKLKVTL